MWTAVVIRIVPLAFIAAVAAFNALDATIDARLRIVHAAVSVGALAAAVWQSGQLRR